MTSLGKHRTDVGCPLLLLQCDHARASLRSSQKRLGLHENMPCILEIQATSSYHAANLASQNYKPYNPDFDKADQQNVFIRPRYIGFGGGTWLFRKRDVAPLKDWQPKSSPVPTHRAHVVPTSPSTRKKVRYYEQKALYAGSLTWLAVPTQMGPGQKGVAEGSTK